jgi:hypothetical protein
MLSQDKVAVKSTAVRHEDGWAPTSTMYSPAAAPVLSCFSPSRSSSTTSSRADPPTATIPGQQQRGSYEARRKQLKNDRNRWWMEQRDRRRARGPRAAGSAARDTVEAGDRVKRVKNEDFELKPAEAKDRDAELTVQADPGNTNTSSIEPVSRPPTIHARRASLISHVSDDAAKEAQTTSSLSAYVQGRMRLDPRASEGGYYRHSESYW